MNREPVETGIRTRSVFGSHTPRVRAFALLLVGTVLLGAAIRIALGAASSHQALHALAGASKLSVAALLGLPIANLILTAATFLVLTNRHGRVRMGEMTALISSSWLLSFVGMFGRIAYHKAMHGIPVRASARVLLEALACSGLCVLLLLGLTLVAQVAGLGGAPAFGLLALPALGFIAASVLLRRKPASNTWRWPAALAYRYLDMAVWAVRYSLVFALLFRPLTLVEAAGLAAAAQAAMLLPIQIGAREWVIGLLGTQLALSASGGGTDAVSPGLLADLVNRAAELAVAVPLGVWATIWLIRRWRRHLATRSEF